MRWFKYLMLDTQSSSPELIWIQRKETWTGDRVANNVRLLSLLIFFIVEMINYHALKISTPEFHRLALTLIAAWVSWALISSVMLHRHLLPKGIPYLMPFIDVSFLTFLIGNAAGIRSPLVVVYFLIICLAGLRLNPTLSVYTALVSIAGLLLVVKFSSFRSDLVDSIHFVVLYVCSMLLAGFIIAHINLRALYLLNIYDARRRE